MTAKAIIREAYLVITIARVAIDIAIDELMKRLLRADLVSRIRSPDPRRSRRAAACEIKIAEFSGSTKLSTESDLADDGADERDKQFPSTTP